MTVIKVATPLPAGPAEAGGPRRGPLVLASLLVLLLLAGAVATLQATRPDAGPRSGQAAQDQAATQDQALAAALAHSFVTDADESARTVTVDMSQDPDAVYAWMAETSEPLDGWTVEITGLEAPAGRERAAIDAASSAAEGHRPVAPQACPDVPAGTRTDGRSTVPYLGCDPATGHEPAATPVRGGVKRSLGAAVDLVLAELLPDAELRASKVTVSGGQAVIDLPAGFPGAASSAPVPAYEIDRALIFTAYSNGALDSVRFRVAGDCLAYATAVDGDMCATVRLPVEIGPLGPALEPAPADPGPAHPRRDEE